MKKKTTYKELFEVIGYLSMEESKDMGLDMKKNTKLTTKAVRFIKNIKSITDEYNERSSDIQRDCASTYPKNKENDIKGLSGCLITEGEKGSFIYTAENLKKRDLELKKMGKEEIEVDVVNCTDMDCINSLSPILKDALNGFLFNIDLGDDEEELQQTENPTPLTVS